MNSDLRTGYLERRLRSTPCSVAVLGSVGPEASSMDVIFVFDSRRDHCAQFCAPCAQICALSRCQRLSLGNDGSHRWEIEEALLRQRFV